MNLNSGDQLTMWFSVPRIWPGADLKVQWVQGRGGESWFFGSMSCLIDADGVKNGQYRLGGYRPILPSRPNHDCWGGSYDAREVQKA